MTLPIITSLVFSEAPMKSKFVTPDAPRDLKPLHPAAQRTMDALVRWTSSNARVEREKEIREKAVREFAEFLATTASPKGTVQREKLQGFATEFLLGRLP